MSCSRHQGLCFAVTCSSSFVCNCPAVTPPCAPHCWFIFKNHFFGTWGKIKRNRTSVKQIPKCMFGMTRPRPIAHYLYRAHFALSRCILRSLTWQTWIKITSRTTGGRLKEPRPWCSPQPGLSASVGCLNTSTAMAGCWSTGTDAH